MGKLISRSLKNPSVFDGIQHGAYTGIHMGSQRAVVLLSLDAVQRLRLNLASMTDQKEHQLEEPEDQQSFLDDLLGAGDDREDLGTKQSGPAAGTQSIDWSSGRLIEILRPINEAEYEQLTAVSIADRTSAQAVFQQIMKVNKNAKKAKEKASRNSEAKRQLRIARELALKASRVAVVSVDLEWHEQDQSVLLEIGWSIYKGMGEDGKDLIENHHWLVEENLSQSNGRFVPDNRRSFLFGESIVGPEAEGANRLKTDCSRSSWRDRLGLKADDDVQLALVGHGMSQDLKVLRSIGVDIEAGVEIIDTNNLLSALYGSSTQVSLRALLSLVEVEGVRKLHNGGNDAAFTLLAFLRLARR